MRFILSLALVGCLLACLAPTASASLVDVTVAVDDPILSIGQTTTVHVSAEIRGGGQPGNGVWAYALSVLFSTPGVVGIESVDETGDPDPNFRGPGVIDAGGLHNIFGGDGGYFGDKGRGVGSPFEVLTLEVRGLAEGDVLINPSRVDAATIQLLGISEGFLLQQFESGLMADFGDGALVTVTPEPASLLLWFGTAAVVAVRSRKRRV